MTIRTCLLVFVFECAQTRAHTHSRFSVRGGRDHLCVRRGWKTIVYVQAVSRRARTHTPRTTCVLGVSSCEPVCVHALCACACTRAPSMCTCVRARAQSDSPKSDPTRGTEHTCVFVCARKHALTHDPNPRAKPSPCTVVCGNRCACTMTSSHDPIPHKTHTRTRTDEGGREGGRE